MPNYKLGLTLKHGGEDRQGPRPFFTATGPRQEESVAFPGLPHRSRYTCTSIWQATEKSLANLISNITGLIFQNLKNPYSINPPSMQKMIFSSILVHVDISCISSGIVWCWRGHFFFSSGCWDVLHHQASWLVTIDLNIAEKNEIANSNNMFFEISPAIGHKVIMFQGGFECEHNVLRLNNTDICRSSLSMSRLLQSPS